MGKSTISMAIFQFAMFVYQRVSSPILECPSHPRLRSHHPGGFPVGSAGSASARPAPQGCQAQRSAPDVGNIYGYLITMGYLWDIYGYLWDIYGYLWISHLEIFRCSILLNQVRFSKKFLEQQWFLSIQSRNEFPTIPRAQKLSQDDISILDPCKYSVHDDCIELNWVV